MECYTSYDLIEWGKPFEKRKSTLPSASGAEVLVRVTAAGLCHSDLHVQKGYMDLGEEGRLTFAERGAVLPMTFGHEVAGIVEAVGSDVGSVKVGQQVLVFPWIGCGDCEACWADRESDCSVMRIIGLKQKGGFATHCLVEHEKFLVDIDGLDAADVVPHACAGITVYNALEKLGALREGEWMAIMGCGGLGMNAISIARAMGFDKIIAVDIDDTKLDTALDMGATKVMNSRRDDAVAELQELAQGRLMGVLDTFGGASTGQIAVRALSKAGRYLLVGQAGGNFQMPQVWLPQKALTVRGSHVGNSPQLRALIEMVRAGKIKQMPIERRPLSEINQAVEDLEEGRVTGRIVFQPDENEEKGVRQ
jgi:D-arabinose 1-dehydrogenase-like Zn-dependent alcohol dehydrogenase